MKFRDIPQFKRSYYRITMPWEQLDRQLESWKYYNLKLDPDFQRAHVWTEDKKSAYVEFILRGGQSGREIFFNCDVWESKSVTPQTEMVLVDGKQRLDAVLLFIHNKLPIFTNSTIGPFFYEDFKDRLHPTDHSFYFNVGALQTRAEVLQWYLEFNSGGVVHTEEELNHVRDLLDKELNGG